ncbi:MAG: sterol desaturase family protein [Spirulinaceae cyanobacterium RM2_2_10]|nr:sterol desaturase family protein [Spirulinaceae cyanobacterium RM2_2_10]
MGRRATGRVAATGRRLFAELGYYWAHWLLHHVPWLWRFHAVHHSSEQLDWLSTVRVHPVDQVFTKTFQLVPIFLLGFSVETLGLYALFSSAIAFFIHANLRWRFGWFNWLLVTPEFHHWHHADEAQAHNKNLAAQCSLVDRLFGSFYLPRRRPRLYGIPESVPQAYWQQLIYPFTRHQRHARP